MRSNALFLGLLAFAISACDSNTSTSSTATGATVVQALPDTLIRSSVQYRLDLDDYYLPTPSGTTLSYEVTTSEGAARVVSSSRRMFRIEPTQLASFRVTVTVKGEERVLREDSFMFNVREDCVGFGDPASPIRLKRPLPVLPVLTTEPQAIPLDQFCFVFGPGEFSITNSDNAALTARIETLNGVPTLLIEPGAGGTSTLTLNVTDDSGHNATFDMAAASLGATSCPTTPPGFHDFFPISSGTTWRFNYGKVNSGPSYLYGESVSGIATWTFVPSAACSHGTAKFTLQESIVGTHRTNGPTPDQYVDRAYSETNTYEVVATTDSVNIKNLFDIIRYWSLDTETVDASNPGISLATIQLGQEKGLTNYYNRWQMTNHSSYVSLTRIE